MENEDNLVNKVDAINSELVKANAFNENASLSLDLIYNFLDQNRNIFGSGGSSLPNLDNFFDKNGYVPVKVLNPCCHKKEGGDGGAGGKKPRRKRTPREEEEERQRQRQGQRQGQRQAQPGKIFIPGEITQPGTETAPPIRLPGVNPYPVGVPVIPPLAEPLPADQPIKNPGTAPPAPVPVTPEPLDNPIPVTPPITVPGPDSIPIFKPRPDEPQTPANDPREPNPDSTPIFKPEIIPKPANDPNAPQEEELPAAASLAEDFAFARVLTGLSSIFAAAGAEVSIPFLAFLGAMAGSTSFADTIDPDEKYNPDGSRYIDPRVQQMPEYRDPLLGPVNPNLGIDFLQKSSYSLNDNSNTDEITLEADEIKFTADVMRFRYGSMGENTTQGVTPNTGAATTTQTGYQPPSDDGAASSSATTQGGTTNPSATPSATPSSTVKPMDVSASASEVGNMLNEMSAKTFMTAKVRAKPKPENSVQSQPIVYGTENTGPMAAAIDNPHPAMTTYHQQIFNKSGMFA